MSKQLAELKKSAPAQPDRAVKQTRKETAQRIEELKLKLMVLADTHFELSLRILKDWLKDGEKGDTQKKR